MNSLDWTLIGIAVFSILRGLMRGAISQLFGIAGVLGGFFVASHSYQTLAAQLAQAFPKLTGPQVISFILLFFLTWFCIGLVGFWIARVLHGTGLGSLDRLWGGVIGSGKALVLAVILISVLTFFLSSRSALLSQSALVPYVQEAAQLLIKATPEGVQKLFDVKRKELQRYWMERGQGEPRPRPPKKREA